MPKHTLLRERAFVAKATNDVAEIDRLRKQILDVFASCGRSLLKTAQKYGVSQMTLRRVAQDLDMERSLGINRARGEPVLLFAQARVALETGNQVALAELKKKIADALKTAGRGGYRQAADTLGVSQWSLKRTIEALGLGVDMFPGKFSPLGERVLVAQRAEDSKALREIKLEIVDIAQRASSVEAAAAELGVSPRTLRNIAASLGLRKALGVDGQKNEPVLLLSRARIALADKNRTALAALRKEVTDAVAAAGGTLNQAAEALGVETAALRQAIAALGLTKELREKFPGQGKDRPLTVRVDGRNVTHTVAEWARLRGINRTTILERLKRDKSPEDAVSQADLRESAQGARVAQTPAPKVCKYSADHPRPKRGDVCSECRAREVIFSDPKRVCKYSVDHPRPKYGDICADCRARDAQERKKQRAIELKEKRQLRKQQPLSRYRGPALHCKYSSAHAAPSKGDMCDACRKERKLKKRKPTGVYVPSEAALPVGQISTFQSSNFFPIDEPDDFPMEELDFEAKPAARRKRRAS